MILTDVGIFAVAIYFLIKFSDISVKQSVKLADYLGISTMTVGFFLIAVSTSLPELAVTSIAALMKETQISVGNIIGSNIANILLIFGLGSFISTIKIMREEMRKIKIVLIIVSVLSLMILILHGISRFLGTIFVLLFILFSYYFLKKGKDEKKEEVEASLFERIKIVLLLFLSLIGVIVSSYFIVRSTKAIGVKLGLSEALIGATIVAVGTSLPELSINIFAIKSKNYSLATGNIIGSCIINMTLILGIGSLITPVSLSVMPNVMTLIFFLNLSNLLFWALAGDREVWIVDGLFLLLLYIFFILTSSGLLVWEFLV
jgi:cation:H+ antiporter